MRRLDVLFLLTKHRIFGEGYFETGEILLLTQPQYIIYIIYILAHPASWLIMTSSAGWGRWIFSVWRKIADHISQNISSVVILLFHRSLEKDSLALFRVHIVNHGLQPRSQLCNTNLFQAKKIKITLYSSLLPLSLSLSHLVVSTSHVLVVVVDLRLGTTPGGRGADVVYHLWKVLYNLFMICDFQMVPS